MRTAAMVSAAVGVAVGLAFCANAADEEFAKKQKAEATEHSIQQQQENREFERSLKGMTPEQRKEAIKKHEEAQHAENRAFRSKQQQEDITYLKGQLAGNTNLTDEVKTELCTFFVERYEEHMVLKEQGLKEATAFLQKITGNQNLNMDQRKERIKDYVEKKKEEERARKEKK